MTTYTVQPGDTLGKIARTFYGNPSKFSLIASANQIPDPDALRVGQILAIPFPPDGSGRVSAGSAALLGARTVELNEQRLARLHPALASRGRAMVELCAGVGVAILVTQGLRTWEEQDRLYAIGRTRPPIGRKFIVTNAPGGRSWHNFGLALDVVVLEALGKADWDTGHPGWARAGEIGKSLGLAWGGDWKAFKDLPHFQYVGDLTLAICRQLFPSGIEVIWQRVA